MTESVTVRPSDVRSSRGQTHVLVFVQETEDRARLDEWLRQQYTVSAGAAPAALDREVADDHGWASSVTDGALGGVRFVFSTASGADSSEDRPATSDGASRR